MYPIAWTVVDLELLAEYKELRNRNVRSSFLARARLRRWDIVCYRRLLMILTAHSVSAEQNIMNMILRCLSLEYHSSESDENRGHPVNVADHDLTFTIANLQTGFSLDTYHLLLSRVRYTMPCASFSELDAIVGDTPFKWSRTSFERLLSRPRYEHDVDLMI